MSSSSSDTDQGPDLTKGVPLSDILDDGVLGGHVGEDPVILARIEGKIVALSGACTHYSGPLKDGLRVGDTVFCPWHHACFDLKSGRAIRAPALNPLDRWEVEQSEDHVVVRNKASAELAAAVREATNDPKKVVIVGGGGAGFAAAERLRELGYKGELTLLSADERAPYDRPNVSKDYLAGEADPAWMPLKDESYYRDQHITLKTSVEVVEVNPSAKTVTLKEGESFSYDRLLLATGATPNHSNLPGFSGKTVFVLRTWADGDRLMAAAKPGAKIAVIGASFIGLEVAAALRTRGLEVHVVAPDSLPLEAKLGPELGAFILALHEEHGVSFHLGRNVEHYRDGRLTLDDGSLVEADIVVLGVGVTPRLDLAEAAGLKMERGVLVDASMRTSDPSIFAAGDIARFPNPLGGPPIRVEHWVVAERHGQIAAATMLGVETHYREPPFFWTNHYDVGVSYVGHAEKWDKIERSGSLTDQDAELRYIADGQTIAVVTLGRDKASLEAAVAMEKAR